MMNKKRDPGYEINFQGPLRMEYKMNIIRSDFLRNEMFVSLQNVKLIPVRMMSKPEIGSIAEYKRIMDKPQPWG